MNYSMIYTKKIKNSFSNFGQAGEFKIVNIMNLLQDIAVEYAMKFKISSLDFGKKNMFWVISRYQIEINNIAKLNEDLLISIWRTTHSNLYDLRWFKIESEDKKEIVNAVGAWVIINKKTKSPAHLDNFMTDKMLCKNEINVKEFFYNLKMIENTDNEQSFKIRMHDLDLNGHVNNTTYVEWAIEALPENILKTFTIKKINIVFLKESFYPGQIISKTQINNSFDKLVTYHSIRAKDKKIELARLNIIWKPL